MFLVYRLSLFYDIRLRKAIIIHKWHRCKWFQLLVNGSLGSFSNSFWLKMKLLGKIKLIQLKIIDWFLSEPKRLVRLVVLSICSIVVFFQLWECVMKLLHPPISTASHFDLNRTMHYPAVTFCRNPSFKVDVMEVGRKIISRWKMIS